MKTFSIIISTIILLFVFNQIKYAQDNTIFNSNYLESNNNLNEIIFDTVLILPLGNSITFDWRSNEMRDDEDKYGYRLPLYNMLMNFGLNFDFIGSEQSGSNFLPTGFSDNAGFPGISDLQLLNLLETGWRIQPPEFNYQITQGAYLETYVPDIILLHIGTNGNENSEGTSALEIEGILDEVDRVEVLIGKKIDVVVSRIIDRVPNQSYVNVLNNNIDSMVTDRVTNPLNDAYPDNIFLVDMEDDANIIYSIDSGGTVGNGVIGDMNDDRHPNDKGHVKMASIFSEEISVVYPNPIEIVDQPQNVVTISGLTSTFIVDVESSDTILYQWKRNNDIILGATDSVYLSPPLTIEDNSSKFFCEIRSKLFTVNSDTVTLTVLDTTNRVVDGLIALYTFDNMEGTTIENLINDYPDLDLTINSSSGIEWVPYGLKIVGDPQIYTNEPAIDIYKNIVETNEITLEAWIEPENNLQNGPARIFTFSQDISARNFTFGQQADSFEVRLRTSESTENGKPALNSVSNTVTDSLTHIAYTKDKYGVAKIFINGILNKTDMIPGIISSWDSTYRFGLANEFINDRLWLGKFYLTSIYDRALNSAEILHNYDLKFDGFGNLLEIPTNLVGSLQNETDIFLTWEDNSSRELGFIIERRANRPDSLFSTIDSINANNTSIVDSSIKYDSSYVYRIRAYNKTDYSDYSEEIFINDIPVSVENNLLVNTFNLYQNYPNPFNPKTNIKFAIARESKVQLTIYNTLGQIVKIVHKNQILSTGNYSVVFDGTELASGIYLYRLIAAPTNGTKPFVKINKAILIK